MVYGTRGNGKENADYYYRVIWGLYIGNGKEHGN